MNGLKFLLDTNIVIGLLKGNVKAIDERVEQETIRLRKVTSLKLPDAIIAATSVVHNAALLTLDDKLASHSQR